MEMVIISLLFVLVVLVVLHLWRFSKSDGGKEKIESVLNERFIDFSDRIRQTMDNTRREVESSKDVISKNALKTLEQISEMKGAVGDLIKHQEKAEQLGQSLEYLLQTPKLRGNYGEAILEEILERVLPKGIWERQYIIEGGEKVDAAVRFKDVVIPIDSKFPKEDYQKYLAASDDTERRMYWAKYEKALKTQINSIKEKYVKPEKGTTEFALLFIPSESIYYETIAEKNYLGDPCEIQEYAVERKVIPVSPNTFYAFLQIIVLGIRNIEIVRGAKKLQESLLKIEKDFGFFYDRFESIGKAIEKASDAYEVGEKHVQRFKKNLDSTLELDGAFQEKASGELPKG